ncbi:unnamed protein product [Enterobius vermicularis]|uniref:Glycine cleavage system H protein n=1 Tax=Enterobius vermicularis TaxID=51028 RepID=A0A0N4V3Z4_ENTVE|nr:unnamed protein product [Enterobius vermicularis]
MVLLTRLSSLPRLMVVTGLRSKFVRSLSSTPSLLSGTVKIQIAERLYTKKHEWITVEDKVGTVGISSHAQSLLGDIVYAELPEIDTELVAGDAAAAVESVKAASDVYSPVSGTVIERNNELEANPSLINKSCYDKGWLFKVSVNHPKELDILMDEKAYEVFLKEEAEAEHE